jgi:hypothetical protein
MQKIIKLYEAKDASLNISLRLDPLCWMVGPAMAIADVTRDVKVRMVSLHLGPACFSFTAFGIRDEPLPRAPLHRRSPTRQSGQWKPK